MNGRRWTVLDCMARGVAIATGLDEIWHRSCSAVPFGVVCGTRSPPAIGGCPLGVKGVMAAKKKWVRNVKTVSAFPPEGLFAKDAETIARAMASKKVSP
jgi:hypothetical protein